ncbi:hypothetical protein E2C01_089062 [Portunus trituberculatus]|uniref:Uncharacterized protein n=1 Tax=Portunus trituberculatus TaxID=210409 RepID=A0A5B7JH37_PORTR|nr:hypothetical protein [Portunus trituberculatus]
MNGTNADKPLTNGRKIENGDQEIKTEEDEDSKTPENTTKHQQSPPNATKTDNVETSLINGETDGGEKEKEASEGKNDPSDRPRKGKMKGGGGKGKGLLKNSEVVAMRERRVKEKRREAAIKAAEIYRKIQEGGEEEEEEEEDEEDEDETFEDTG